MTFAWKTLLILFMFFGVACVGFILFRQAEKVKFRNNSLAQKTLRYSVPTRFIVYMIVLVSIIAFIVMLNIIGSFGNLT